MAAESVLSPKQTEQDLSLGVQAFEQWKSLAAEYREKSRTAYALTFKVSFQTLADLAEAAAHNIQSVLDAMRPPGSPASTAGLRPVEPEWRPGVPAVSGD